MGGGSVLVLAASSALVKTYIVFCENKLKSVKNCDNLETKLLLEAHDLFWHRAYPFVHDSAPIHSSGIIQHFSRD